MPITRAQKNGTEPLIKISKKTRKKKTDFIMQDSWDASLTGASKAGIKAVILMCYFHVIYNIKKLYKHTLTKAECHELRGFICDIHLARSEQERDERWAKFKARYKPKKGLLYYFNSQYLFDLILT